VSVSENRVALELARGIGAFLGAIHPGGWREGLAPRQIEIVERTTAPILMEFYPDNAS
jgi:hypothetical protein